MSAHSKRSSIRTDALKAQNPYLNALKAYTRVAKKWQADRTKELQEQAANSKANLQRLPQKIHMGLRKDLKNALKDFKNICEDEVYAHIATNVSDDSVEQKAKEVVEKYAKVFNESAMAKIEAQGKAFKEAVEAELQAFSLKAGVIEGAKVGVNASVGGLDTDSGVDWWKLGGAGMLGGMLVFDLVNIWNPLGWLGTIATIGTALGLAYNALKKLWNYDFKKSEQRKAFDKQLGEVVGKIRRDIGLHESMEGIIEKIRNMEARSKSDHDLATWLKDFLKYESTLVKIYKTLEEAITGIIGNLEDNLKQREAVCVEFEKLARGLSIQADHLHKKGSKADE